MVDYDRDKAIDAMIKGSEGKEAIRKWKSKNKKTSKGHKQQSKKLEKKLKHRSILKQDKATVAIKEHKPAEYVSTFFKDKQEDAEMALFFK